MKVFADNPERRVTTFEQCSHAAEKFTGKRLVFQPTENDGKKGLPYGCSAYGPDSHVTFTFNDLETSEEKCNGRRACVAIDL